MKSDIKTRGVVARGRKEGCCEGDWGTPLGKRVKNSSKDYNAVAMLNQAFDAVFIITAAAKFLPQKFLIY